MNKEGRKKEGKGGNRKESKSVGKRTGRESF